MLQRSSSSVTCFLPSMIFFAIGDVTSNTHNPEERRKHYPPHDPRHVHGNIALPWTHVILATHGRDCHNGTPLPTSLIHSIRVAYRQLVRCHSAYCPFHTTTRPPLSWAPLDHQKNLQALPLRQDVLISNVTHSGVKRVTLLDSTSNNDQLQPSSITGISTGLNYPPPPLWTIYQFDATAQVSPPRV